MRLLFDAANVSGAALASARNDLREMESSGFMAENISQQPEVAATGFHQSSGRHDSEVSESGNSRHARGVRSTKLAASQPNHEVNVRHRSPHLTRRVLLRYKSSTHDMK